MYRCTANAEATIVLEATLEKAKLDMATSGRGRMWLGLATRICDLRNSSSSEQWTAIK